MALEVAYENYFDNANSLDDFTIVDGSSGGDGTVSRNAGNDTIEFNLVTTGEQGNKNGMVMTNPVGQIAPEVGVLFTAVIATSAFWPIFYFCLTNSVETFLYTIYNGIYVWYNAGKARALTGGGASSTSTDKPSGGTLTGNEYTYKIELIQGSAGFESEIWVKLTIEGDNTVSEEIIDENLSSGAGPTKLDVSGWTSLIPQFQCRRTGSISTVEAALSSLVIEVPAEEATEDDSFMPLGMRAAKLGRPKFRRRGSGLYVPEQYERAV